MRYGLVVIHRKALYSVQEIMTFYHIAIEASCVIHVILNRVTVSVYRLKMSFAHLSCMP